MSANAIDHIQCGADGRHPQGKAPDAAAFVFYLDRLNWYDSAWPRCQECVDREAGDPLMRVLPLHTEELASLHQHVTFLERQIERLSLIGNEQAVLAWKEVQAVKRQGGAA